MFINIFASGLRLQASGRKLAACSLQPAAICFILLSIVPISGCNSRHLYTDTQVMMGTFVEVVSQDKQAGEIVFKEIKRIENLLSKYIPGSEVSRLNLRAKLTVSRETFYIIKKSKEFWMISDGAFDITTGPLSDL